MLKTEYLFLEPVKFSLDSLKKKGYLFNIELFSKKYTQPVKS